MKNKNNISKEIYFVLLGVLLGVFGSLFANILERHFRPYGFLYELFVAVLFFGTFSWFYRKIK